MPKDILISIIQIYRQKERDKTQRVIKDFTKTPPSPRRWRKILGFFFLFSCGDMVADAGEKATKQPAGRVGHSDGDDLITDLAHKEQVKLPEAYEGGKHNDHRRNGVSPASQSAGIDLVESKQHVEGGQSSQEHGAGFHNCFVWDQEADD